MNPYAIYWDARGYWVLSRNSFIIDKADTLFELAVAILKECIRVNEEKSE